MNTTIHTNICTVDTSTTHYQNMEYKNKDGKTHSTFNSDKYWGKKGEKLKLDGKRIVCLRRFISYQNSMKNLGKQ